MNRQLANKLRFSYPGHDERSRALHALRHLLGNKMVYGDLDIAL